MAHPGLEHVRRSILRIEQVGRSHGVIWWGINDRMRGRELGRKARWTDVSSPAGWRRQKSISCGADKTERTCVLPERKIQSINIIARVMVLRTLWHQSTMTVTSEGLYAAIISEVLPTPRIYWELDVSTVIKVRKRGPQNYVQRTLMMCIQCYQKKLRVLLVLSIEP